MNKMINGKRYNTDASDLIGTYVFGESHSPESYTEWLYLKRTGEFFLYVEGGEKSKYARRISYSHWSGDARILPYTREQAKEWSEKHLDPDTIDRVFGTIKEDNDKKVVTFSLPIWALDILKKMTTTDHRAKSEIIADLLRKEWSRIESQKGE